MNRGVSIYRNAMEPLAIEEIDQQMQLLPIEVVKSINKADAIAYALNRLPPLYATTEEGWTWQQERARETLQHLICKAASWGLRAAQRPRKGFATLLQQPQPVPLQETGSEQLTDDQLEPKQPVKNFLKLLAG